MRNLPAILLLLLVASCVVGHVPGRAAAVVISTGDGSGNTAAPIDDPGFANVGVSHSNLSGVYLGNRWVLTAAHVGDTTSFTFDGVLYATVPGSRRLLAKDGTPIDLAMVRLVGTGPPLPDVVLPTAPIAEGELMVMIGNGWSRAPTSTCWTGLWVETPCPDAYEGFERLGARTLRWGRNRVISTGYDLPGSGGRLTRTFEAEFDAKGETDEAQAVSGDSGGASFVKRGGVWELAGIHVAMGAFMSQPTNVVAYGNTSFDADVFHYRSEIEAVLLTPPKVPALPGVALWGTAAALVVAARCVTRRRRGPV